MKALLCKKFGGTEGLKIEEVSLPKLGPDDVLISVAACGLNFPDLLILENKYQFKPELPFSPGGEVTGIVFEVGENVKEFSAGQRVFAIERWGGLAEKMIAHKDRLLALPDEMDFVTGASVMYNMSTALYALKNIGKAKPGEKILILGASGGVGLAAVQLAKILGLTVVGVAGSKEKLNVCGALGADFLINYKEDNLRDKVKETTSGIDLVLDTVGGEWSEQALKTMNFGGRYLVVGFAAGEVPRIPLNLILLKGTEVKGVFWGKFSRENPAKQNENTKEIFSYFRTGELKSYLGRTYAFEEASLALSDFKERTVIGKSVVICNQKLVNEDEQRVRPQQKGTKFVFLSQEHLLECEGTELGESQWFTVSQEVINDFADATHDHQWIHVQASLADKSPMGSTIAHGFLTISLSPKFLNEIYEMPFVKMGINYGVDKLRFLRPVKVNTQLKMKAKLLTAERVKNGGIKLRMEALYYSYGTDVPVCSAELLSVVYC